MAPILKPNGEIGRSNQSEESISTFASISVGLAGSIVAATLLLLLPICACCLRRRRRTPAEARRKSQKNEDEVSRSISFRHEPSPSRISEHSQHSQFEVPIEQHLPPVEIGKHGPKMENGKNDQVDEPESGIWMVKTESDPPRDKHDGQVMKKETDLLPSQPHDDDMGFLKDCSYIRNLATPTEETIFVVPPILVARSKSVSLLPPILRARSKSVPSHPHKYLYLVPSLPLMYFELGRPVDTPGYQTLDFPSFSKSIEVSNLSSRTPTPRLCLNDQFIFGDGCVDGQDGESPYKDSENVPISAGDGVDLDGFVNR